MQAGRMMCERWFARFGKSPSCLPLLAPGTARGTIGGADAATSSCPGQDGGQEGGRERQPSRSSLGKKHESDYVYLYQRQARPWMRMQNASLEAFWLDSDLVYGAGIIIKPDPLQTRTW